MEKMIKNIYRIFFKKFKGKNIASGESFFEYSSAEKKKIVKNAAREANKMQLRLLREFEKANYF